MSELNAQPVEKWRPRFSMLTSLLVTALVASAITIGLMWREIGPLRREVRELRNLTDRLTIDDPQLVHAVRAETTEPDFWRWQFYVPKTGKHYLHLQPEKVPKEGLPPSPNSRAGWPLLPGEYFMELRLLPSEKRANELVSVLKWHTTD